MINVESFEEYKEYKPLPTKSWINRTFSPMSIGSVRASIYTLCASIIGAGELSLPLAVSQCGLVSGVLLLILGGALFSYYYYQLAYVSDEKGIYDYVTLVKSFYGEVILYSGWTTHHRNRDVFCLLWGCLCIYGKEYTDSCSSDVD